MAMNGKHTMEEDDFSRFPKGFDINLTLTQHTGYKRKRKNEENTIELSLDTKLIWWSCTYPNVYIVWKNHTIYVNNDTNNKRRNSMKQAHLARHKRHKHSMETSESLNLNRIQNPRRKRLFGKQKPLHKVIVRPKIKNLSLIHI